MTQLFALLFLLVGCATVRPVAQRPDPVVLISIDGFRHGYLKELRLPTLTTFAVRNKLSPPFPSLTFPCHYTLATGLTPAHHGIVGNEMYDPRTEKSFRISDRAAVADPDWWGGEPIWITVEKAGIPTAPYFWVGSSTEIQGRRPTYWIPYDQTTPRATRVQRVLDLLDLPDEKRPRFITTYFDDVDSAGHAHGPRSPEVAAAARDVDASIGELLAGLAKRGLDDKVTVIVVSDHGMTDVVGGLPLEGLLPPGDARLVGGGAMVNVFPEKKSEAELLAALARRPAHVSCGKKGELRGTHDLDHPRVAPIVCISDLGYYLTTKPGQTFPKGAHGWDPEYDDMLAIFLARGPGATKLSVHRSVDLYAALAELLGVPPAPNDAGVANATEPPR